MPQCQFLPDQRVHHFESALRVAAIDTAPLRFEGYQALLSPEPDIRLTSVSLSPAQGEENIDVALLYLSDPKYIADTMKDLQRKRAGVRIVLTAAKADDRFIFEGLRHGAKGCVDEAASGLDLARAVRAVHGGTIWAPRRVLSAFVDHMLAERRQPALLPGGHMTARERQVLEMLVAGHSNKEIAGPLGIEERTVKGHVSKLMRKVGVQNRIMLSVHAVSNALVLSR